MRCGLLLAISNDDGRIGIPPDPQIIEGIRQMTPSEMEQEIKNLNVWVEEVRQNLPLLATKEDLKAFATKEELREAVAPLATQELVRNLILVTRREIRHVDDKLTSMAVDVRKIAEQAAIQSTRARRKR